VMVEQVERLAYRRTAATRLIFGASAPCPLDAFSDRRSAA
jgi:hypothetical protein